MSARALVALAGILVWAAAAAPLSAQAEAVPTRLVVRVLAHDAKLVGTGVGGARVSVRDAATGAVLAEGVQEGGTGSTDAIVRTPRARGATVFDTEGAAGWSTELALTKPTLVEVRAEGPLGTPDDLRRASKTLLLIPGVDLVGEGVVLELNGFTVEVEEAVPGDGEVAVRARVTMLCGCPTEPGGLWDADRIQVTAQLLRDGAVVTEAPLAFAGETSIYEGRVAAGSGSWELRVVAVEPERANTGMAARTVRVP